MRIDLDAPRAAIPYLANWIGVWAIHVPAGQALAEMIGSTSIRRHLSTVDPDELAEAKRYDYAIADGVAIINVDGPIMKHRSSMGGSCSTVELRRLVRQAVADPKVRGICFRIESPGGSVSGTPEAFEEIRKASQSKPTMAFAEDLCASAGYWLACGADRIVANEAALVGSIGVYTVVADSSARAKADGVLVHVVRTGQHKGAGEPGTEITEDHLAHWQTEVDGLNALFLRAVKTGRDFDDSTLERIADGRCHLAKDALSLGLIDAVGSFEAAFEDFRASLDGTGPDENEDESDEAEPYSAASKESAAMSAEQPVTVAQLEKHFPRSSAAWRLRCISAGMTLTEASAQYANLLEAKVAELNERLSVAGKRKPGHSLELTGKAKKKARRRSRAEEMLEEEEEDELLEDAPVDPADMTEPVMPEDEEDPEAMDEEEEEVAEEEEDNVEARFQRLYSAKLRQYRGDGVKALRALNRERPGLVAAYRKAKAAQILRNRRRARRGR